MIVDPTKPNENTHHIKLTDSSATEVGFITSNSYGDKKPQVSVNPYPTMASQLRQGRGKHADRVPPFEDIALSDFSGGLAMLHHDEDASKYYDGKRCDTSREGEVINGGLETYTSGIRDFDENWPGNVTWQALYSGATESVTKSFVAGASYNANSVVVILKKTGAPTGNVTVSLLSSADAELKSKSLAIGTGCLTDLVSERVEFEFASVQALTASTTYKVKVEYTGGSSTAYVEVAVDGSAEPYYRVLDDTGDFSIIFQEYKSALYGITQPVDRSASTLYLLGDRGLADDNTGALTTLVDATKSWATNEWAGCVVRILGDSKEEIPYRTISSNNGTTLTVSEAWANVHTTDTRYVIYGEKWTSQQVLDGYAYCATTVGDKMYIGFGNPAGASTYIRRWREFSSSGVWTTDFETEENSAAGAIQLLGVTEEAKWKYPSAIVGELWAYAKSTSPWSNLLRHQVPYKDISNSNVVKTLCENDRAWIDTTYANVSYDYLGNYSTINIAAGFGTGKVAHWKLDSPIDVRNGTALLLKFRITAGYTTDGDLTIILADSEGNEDSYNINPNATVDGGTTGTQARYIFLDAPGAETADPSDITDIYINVAVDRGAGNLRIYGPVYLTGDRNHYYDRWQDFPMGLICNGMELYAGGAGEITEKPWMLCNKGAYYIDNNGLAKIPLGELEELEHHRSGQGHCINDVYLIWNVGETIQSYYSGHLASIGPDVDYGLPEGRRGIPCSMASYPGRVFSCIDAGASGTSSVIYRRQHGWHEAYRAWENERIKSIHIFGRADSADRLYISEGADVLWIPISINAQTEADYEYNYESVLETSRIYGGLRETEKYYHAINLVTENLSDGNRWIEVDYRTSENSTYTNLSTDFITSPRQRQSLSSSNDTAGRWIQFRFRAYTNDRTETPKMVSAIVDSLERLDSANTYAYNIRLKEGYDHDLRGKPESLTGAAKLTQIQTWVDDPKPLTLNSTSSFENGKLVFIEPERCRVLYSKVDDKGQEVRIYQLTLIEVA